MAAPAYRIVRALVAPGGRRWLRLEVSGAQHVPAQGPVLLAANHRSVLDHLLLALASPRPLRFLGKLELASGPAGWWNRLTGMIPIERGAGDLDALRRVVSHLSAGEAFGIFPEGTRAPTAHVYRFRSGLARLAAWSGAPVVPVGIVGSADGLASPFARPAPHALRVGFGTPLPAPQADPRSRRSFTAEVRRQVAELCGEALHQPADSDP
ncbi:MAG: lysophospholipid acyltransferase family protein [Egibacteraceae bacterium]